MTKLRCLLCTILLTLASIPTAWAASTVVLTIEPPESSVTIGQEIDINILVKAGTQQVDGTSAYLDFDPTYLEVVKMTKGDQLDLILDNSFDNGAGTINFAAGKLTSPFPDGDFELVTITLKAKAETPEAGTPLSFVLNPPRRTDATFGGVSVFDHAEDGSIIIITVEKSALQFSSAAYTTTENGGQATITVTRTINSDGAISIDYATSDDTATAPDDYTQTSGTLNWADGDAADKHIQIDINDDSLQENDETLIVSLGNPTGGAKLGDPDTATVTIKDDDTPTGTVILTIEPPESNVTIGQEFDINILIKAGTQQVDSASAYLEFDPTYLEVVHMTSGAHLDVILDNSFDNGAGSINFAAGKLTSPFPSGDFALVTITLKAKAETSETSLDFLFNPPKRTDATFGGASVFDHAENGVLHITAGGTGTVVMSVVPSTTQVSVGETFEIAIEVQAGTQQINSASAYLYFDPTYLKVVHMTPGEHLDLIIDNSFDNKVGYINFAAGKLISPFPSGDFKLVTIILKAKAETSKTFLDFLHNPPKRTDATFCGTSVLDHAENGNIIIAGAFDCKQVTGISKKKCQALIALYESTDGDNWTNNTGWKVTNTPCRWYGVTCNGGFIEKIELASNNLKGAISKNFLELKYLENMVLFNNDLNGTSFKNFKKLKNLRMLLMNNCNLTGKLPNSLMRLKKLEVLSLHKNCLNIKVSKKLKKWLDKLNPGWDDTQTSCLY